MNFSASDVKNLREKTGCGMMDCKKALAHSNGDEQGAIDFLRKQGLAAANKKSGRIASEGIAFAKSARSGGAIIEVNSETDFVAKNDEFKKFVELCASMIIENKPNDIESLLNLKVKNSEQNLNDLLNEKILKIGENIKIRRFNCFDGLTSSYVHADGKIAVLVGFSSDSDLFDNETFKMMAHDIAMQIAAVSPLYLNQADVPQDVLEHEKSILMEQAIAQGKSQQIAERMVTGRIGKYYKENCLMDQEFVKDSSVTISQYFERIKSSIGCNLSVNRFLRFERGEGLEKKSENFADEVSKILN